MIGAISMITLTIGSIFLYASSAKAYGNCSQYGIFAQYDILTNSCKCMNGYVFKDSFIGTSCVSANSVCVDKFGYGAKYDLLRNSCTCTYGYVLGTDSIGRTQCITEDQACKNQLGQNSRSTYDNKCECSYGYVISGGKCEDGNSVCREKYGIHSSYNSSSNSCGCDNGYTFSDSNKCVKKQNNVYFVLKELNTDDRQAIIKSEYDNRYYLIHYGVGCYTRSFSRYISHQIVVNLGTDFNLDAWDKIVLQDDDETCDITRVERANSLTTFIEEADMLSANNLYIIYPRTETQTLSFITAPNALNTNNPIKYPESGRYNPAKKDLTLIARLKGHILLQVEEHGEAWYLNPTDSDRYYMPDGAAAYTMMRSFGLGITDIDLNTIASVSSSQDMMASVSACTSSSLANKLKGKILLQIQQHGEAWYIDPRKCRKIYMKDGDAAYQIMRYLGLGVTNVDLEKLPSK